MTSPKRLQPIETRMNEPTDTVNSDEFWAFSLGLYAKPEVSKTCLQAQDDWGLDINLLLLFGWLAQKGIDISPAGWTGLLAASEHWQTNILIPFREKRRSAKSTPEYETLKSEELALEKQEQQALCNIVSRHLSSPSSMPKSTMIERYFQTKNTDNKDLRIRLERLLFAE